MAKIGYKEGAQFPELPTKTPVLCKIIESQFIEDDENPWYGKETGKFDKSGAPIIDNREFRNLVKVVFESIEEDTSGSRIWFNATASINEKSKLRPLLEAAAFATDPTNQELEEYDTDELVGQYVYVTGSFGPKDTEHKFLRPESFLRYKEQFKPGFKKPGKTEAKPAASEEDDEVAALQAKLAAAKAKKAAPAAQAEESQADRLRRELAELEAAQEGAGTGERVAETKAERKPSTREKAVAKTAAKAAKAEPEDPEAAF